jgi:lipopolysaccharide/colanic/teichoic acid biosynthesis glycosyltransferase
VTYRNAGKRLFDLALALPLLVLGSPLLLSLALLTRRQLGAPVLFKFRTMTGARDAAGRLLPDARRLTPFGRWLRSTSLDELPELINVVRGEMSLVGPRPLLMQYLERYTPEQMRRHEVKPGLTGWAQVNGRNALTWEEKFAHDVWYVEHCSPWLDVKIILATIGQVLRREGINQDGEATAAEFTGKL